MTKSIYTIFLIFSFVNFAGCSAQTGYLIEATKSGNINLVQELNMKGVDINCRDKTGQSPLHHACYYGHFGIVKYLIANGADINIKVPEIGSTPLHAATMNGSYNLVKYLVEQGAEVNAKDNEGATPLIPASWIGKLEVVKYLVEKGAEVNVKTEYGTTPLHYAAQSGNIALVKYFIDNNININVRAMNGATPLHLAVVFGDDATVEYLLSKGAKIDLQTKWESTFTRVLNAPILSDDDVMNVTVNKNQTPVDIANEKGNFNILELFEKANRK